MKRFTLPPDCPIRVDKALHSRERRRSLDVCLHAFRGMHLSHLRDDVSSGTKGHKTSSRSSSGNEGDSEHTTRTVDEESDEELSETPAVGIRSSYIQSLILRQKQTGDWNDQAVRTSVAVAVSQSEGEEEGISFLDVPINERKRKNRKKFRKQKEAANGFLDVPINERKRNRRRTKLGTRGQ